MEAIHDVNAVLWQPGEQAQKSQTERQTNVARPRVNYWFICMSVCLTRVCVREAGVEWLGCVCVMDTTMSELDSLKVIINETDK